MRYSGDLQSKSYKDSSLVFKKISNFIKRISSDHLKKIQKIKIKFRRSSVDLKKSCVVEWSLPTISNMFCEDAFWRYFEEYECRTLENAKKEFLKTKSS